ncbi:MAG TPA: SRPBCC family protein [Gemmatimonadaceae bacterium]|nr:SRPBCC family protein [Gemmatimonadaceae bacterium]
MTPGANTATASDREIVVARTIDAPRALVFSAYTDEKHLAAWWGPNGFTTTTHRFSFRVGGIWDFIMHGPDGTDYPNYIEYREIVPPERIVLLHGDRAGDPKAFVSTIEFVERDGATEITLRALFKTKAMRDDVVERFGAIEGGKQTLCRLAVYVATLTSEHN